MKMPRRVTPLRSGLAFVEPRISFQPDSACPLPAEFGHQSSPFDGQVVFVSGGHETYSTSMKMHSPWPVLSVVPTIVTAGARATESKRHARLPSPTRLKIFHTLRGGWDDTGAPMCRYAQAVGPRMADVACHVA